MVNIVYIETFFLPYCNMVRRLYLVCILFAFLFWVANRLTGFLYYNLVKFFQSKDFTSNFNPNFNSRLLKMEIHSYKSTQFYPKLVLKSVNRKVQLTFNDIKIVKFYIFYCHWLVYLSKASVTKFGLILMYSQQF